MDPTKRKTTHRASVEVSKKLPGGTRDNYERYLIGRSNREK